MALKDTWVDKVDGVDDVLAEDINSIAHGVIENEDRIVYVTIENNSASHSAQEIYDAVGEGKQVFLKTSNGYARRVIPYLQSNVESGILEYCLFGGIDFSFNSEPNNFVYKINNDSNNSASFQSFPYRIASSDSISAKAIDYTYYYPIRKLEVKTDDAPTENSPRLLTSGTIYNIVKEINESLGSYIDDIDALIGE